MPTAMMVRPKLMGVLKAKTPENGQLEIEDGATIEDVLRALDVPVGSVQVFTVNGSLERDRSRVLSDGDDLSVLPPVGGG
ncbi:MAG: MoaD/ThiS family protein [Pirellulaceae bacterium]|jgi:molybdopterin converting factor small subunit|nr:MoaD/ThiS family protein [Pirellulaceae bacterium]